VVTVTVAGRAATAGARVDVELVEGAKPDESGSSGADKVYVAEPNLTDAQAAQEPAAGAVPRPKKRRMRTVLIVLSVLVGIVLLAAAVSLGSWFAGVVEKSIGRQQNYQQYNRYQGPQ
jgi:hypothetical protein